MFTSVGMCICAFICAHLQGHVPMRTPSSNSTVCSRCTVQLHGEQQGLSAQAASLVSTSQSEPKIMKCHIGSILRFFVVVVVLIFKKKFFVSKNQYSVITVYKFYNSNHNKSI